MPARCTYEKDIAKADPGRGYFTNGRISDINNINIWGNITAKTERLVTYGAGSLKCCVL